MNDKEIVVAYPHDIKFINKVGGSISYYVDRKVSDYVKELQKDNDKLQSNWNSLREWLLKEIINTKQKWGNKLTDKGYLDIAMTVRSYEIILDKMNELEGKDNNE